MMVPYAASKRVPAPMAAVLDGRVLLLAGALSTLFGVWADLGALQLVVFLIPTAVMMHGFWKETDPQARMNEMTQFSKDLALAGAALMLFAFFSHTGDGLGLTVSGPLFHLRGVDGVAHQEHPHLGVVAFGHGVGQAQAVEGTFGAVGRVVEDEQDLAAHAGLLCWTGYSVSGCSVMAMNLPCQEWYQTAPVAALTDSIPTVWSPRRVCRV
jgi:hypothetical protein